jgi:MFS family permease
VALAGAALNVIGMIVIGTAHRIDVAIGGMAIAGVGSGFAEVIGTAGITELAPVKSRGLYMGMAYTLILPAAASSRSAIFTGVDMEMGSVDLRHSQWRGIWNAAPVLLASTSHQLTRTQQTADTCSN